jgi:hypothetical protein
MVYLGINKKYIIGRGKEEQLHSSESLQQSAAKYGSEEGLRISNMNNMSHH